MKRHDDAPGWRQRGDRLAVAFGDDLRVVDRFPPACESAPPGVGWVRMKRHYDSQRSDRLAVTQLPVCSLTHSLTHSAASRSAQRETAGLVAPVLTAAPLMRVAHSRHASVRPTADPVGRPASARVARLTADEVGRKLHRSTPACVATLAGTSIQTTDTSVPDQSCRRRMRASRGTG